MIIVFYVIVMIVSGYKLVKSVYYGIKSCFLDMNVLMIVVVFGVVVIGEWFEGVMVVWLFVLGVVL